MDNAGRWFSRIYDGSFVASDNIDDFESRKARAEAALARSYELMQETDRLLAEPRPQNVREWQPASGKRFEIERIEERLAALEEKMNKRFAALEGRLQQVWDGVDGFAAEAGGAVGTLEKKLRKELRHEIQNLRGELVLLRAETKAQSQTKSRKTAVSRAPWTHVDAALTN